jgi:hypothetical protein
MLILWYCICNIASGVRIVAFWTCLGFVFLGYPISNTHFAIYETAIYCAQLLFPLSVAPSISSILG